MKRSRQHPPTGAIETASSEATEGQSRRDFIRLGAAGLAGATAAGLAGASIASGQVPLAGLRSATPRDLQNLVGDGRKRRILLKGGVVLTLDPRVGDFEKADVLIDGKTIAQVAPNIVAGDAEVVDCSGTIVMPGFITTHHHHYETLGRSIIADGRLNGAWPEVGFALKFAVGGPCGPWSLSWMVTVALLGEPTV